MKFNDTFTRILDISKYKNITHWNRIYRMNSHDIPDVSQSYVPNINVESVHIDVQKNPLHTLVNTSHRINVMDGIEFTGGKYYWDRINNHSYYIVSTERVIDNNIVSIYYSLYGNFEFKCGYITDTGTFVKC
jgi:hypothetical protein